MEKDNMIIKITRPKKIIFWFWARAKKLFPAIAAWAMAKKWWILILIAVGIFIIWRLGIIPGLFWLVFLSFLLFEWDSRIIAFLALIFLASCPFSLIFKREALAEQMAIYAYYFLIMTVVLQIIEYVGHPKDEERDNTPRSRGAATSASASLRRDGPFERGIK
jgi:hypothetical protein